MDAFLWVFMENKLVWAQFSVAGPFCGGKTVGSGICLPPLQEAPLDFDFPD